MAILFITVYHRSTIKATYSSECGIISTESTAEGVPIARQHGDGLEGVAIALEPSTGRHRPHKYRGETGCSALLDCGV
jgi:hypothetical protein